MRNHKSHKLLTLADKNKKLNQNLKYFLRDSSEKFFRNLKERHEVVEKAVEEVKKRFRSQYLTIQQQLFEVYQKHIKQLDNEIQKEVSHLDNLNNKTENIKRDLNRLLLDRSDSHNPIQRCGYMIALEKLLTLELSWKRPTYVETSNEASSKDSFELSQLLGDCKYETISVSLLTANKKGLISRPIQKPSQEITKSGAFKIDCARQKSVEVDVKQQNQLSDEVCIT